MGKYSVYIPIAGYISVCVDGVNNEEEAKAKAQEAEWRIKLEVRDGDDVELHELDAYEELITGNVRHFNLNKIEIMEND